MPDAAGSARDPAPVTPRPSGPGGEREAHRAPRRRRLPARLFWRVYLNGLLLLVLVALAMLAVGATLRRHPPGRTPERFAGYAAARLSEVRADPQGIARELRRVREAFGSEVSVYEGDRLLASDVDPPLPPLSPPDRARLAGGAFRVAGRHWTIAAPLDGAPPAYVLLSGGTPPPLLLRGLTLLAAVLVALALASIPLAHAISSPLERLGRAVRLFGAGDLSARARLGDRGEVGEVAHAFDQMADRIERLLRSEKELLANVSHELRTPMARIRVALELAAEGDHERARVYLAEIGADLAELERLVEDVLTAARLDLAAGRESGAALPLRLEAVDGRDLVLRAAERFRVAHPDRALAVSVPDDLPAVQADPALLRRALDNLLDNARKHSGDRASIALRARRAGDHLEVEVRDAGVGLEPADLERLFTPFFRTDRSRARGTGGVGLGLALVKRVVEAHGGEVAAESAPGQGTAVRFRVPAARAVAPAGEPAPPSSS